MTSESTTTTSRRTTNGSETATREGVQGAVSEVRGAIGSVASSVPEVARASRTSLTDAFRAIEGGSDERLAAGVTLSLGLAIGMLLGGAPRLLVLATLAPMAGMGMVLQDRRRQASTTSSARAAS